MNQNKEFYLEMFNFHKAMNEQIMSQHEDIFSLLANEEDQKRIQRNEESMKHAKNILARYFKTFL